MNLGFIPHVGFVRLIEFKDLRACVVKVHCDLNIFDYCYVIARDAFVTLGTRGFSRLRREISVLAEGRHIFGRRPKPRAAKPREKTSGTERCFLPSPLTFELFIGLHLYANQIGSLQLWSCGPARSFSLSCNRFFEMWITGSENHYPWEFLKHPAKNANELGPAWQNIAGNRHIHGQ